MNRLDALYKDIIMDHQKDPRNFGKVENADIFQEGYNPLCGDRIEVSVKLNTDKSCIEKCKFKGVGCSICLASSSIMTEEMEGKSLEEVNKKISDFRSLLQGEKSPDNFDGDIEALSGVRNFPVRIKCALLAWTTLKDALENKEKDHDKSSTTE